LDLAGETTLEAARQAAQFDIQLPTYPEDLGSPDRVFVNDWNDTVITLVWLDPDGSVRMTLEILNATMIATKYYPYGDQEEVRVNGADAYWLTGVHEVYYYTRNANITRHIYQSVLVWTAGRLTYRLETDLSLEDAILTAESLK
jgi:hypothetical protein